MITLKNKYALMELAEKYRIYSIYDLLAKLQHKSGALACTDGTQIYVDLPQFDKLIPMDQMFILSHEMLHIIYKHTDPTVYTFEDYPDRELLNVCQDIVINEYLAKRLRYKQPDGLYLNNFSQFLKAQGYIRDELTYHGVLTTKALYNFLIGRQNNKPFLKSIADALKEAFGDIKDLLPKQSTSDSNDISKQTLKELSTTLKITKQEFHDETGKTPEEINVEGIIEPEEKTTDINGAGQISSFGGKKPTKEPKKISTTELIKYVTKFIGSNTEVKGRHQTYTRPSRRYHSSDLAVKGYKHTKTIKEISIYLDTSGSMNNQFIKDMYFSLQQLSKTTKFSLFEFTGSVREVNLQNDYLMASGGTNINNVLKHIKDNNFDVSIMITDCDDKFSVKQFDSNLMIFTNDMKFKSDNPLVEVTYFN